MSTSPGKASLEPKAFYVAMRAVALAQSGESTLNRKRLRETATDTIPMATFKGCPKPPIENSQGKKPPPRAPQNKASKKKSGSGKEGDPATENARAGSVKKARSAPADDKANKAKTGNSTLAMKGAEARASETNDEGFGKKGKNRVKSAKQKRRRSQSSGSSSDSSEATSDSTNADSSRVGSGTDSGDKRSGSNSGSEKDAINRSSRGADADSVGTASVAVDIEGARRVHTVGVSDKKITPEGQSSSSPGFSSSSGSDSGIGSTAEDDAFVMTDKARARYQVRDA